MTPPPAPLTRSDPSPRARLGAAAAAALCGALVGALACVLLARFLAGQAPEGAAALRAELSPRLLGAAWSALVAACVVVPAAGAAGRARPLGAAGAATVALAFWGAYLGGLLLTYAKVWQFTRPDLLAAQHPEWAAAGVAGDALKAAAGVDTVLRQMHVAALFAAVLALLVVGFCRAAGSHARRGAAAPAPR